MCHSMDGTPPLIPEQQKFPGNPFASNVGNQANNIVATQRIKSIQCEAAATHTTSRTHPHPLNIAMHAATHPQRCRHTPHNTFDHHQ
jgi:hypothetical protein